MPLVNADLPIEKAIQDGLYAYTRNPTKLKPPPNVPPVTMLDAATLDLFERAFVTARRPTATEWRSVLDSAMKQLQRCKNDPQHSYPSAAGKCPWCQLIAVSRLMFFIPGQGTAMPFRPEDIDQLIRKLQGMQITFPAYMRPRPVLPVQVSLPPGLRSILKPSLLTHPTSPAPVPKPDLAKSPPPPLLLPRPQLKPSPPAPKLFEKPPLTPHPAAPPPLQEPLLIPEPVSWPLPRPSLKPHPPIPAEPPRPRLHPLPIPPVYPPMETPGPPDPFFGRVCIAGLLIGLPVLAAAPPVGVFVIVAFGTWWAMMAATDGWRRDLARKSLKEAHESECERMDEEYAELCRPIEEANKQRTDAWQAERSVIADKYQSLCKRIDWENYRQLSAWEEANAEREAKHEEESRAVDVRNEQLIANWEAANSARNAEHTRVCAAIDAANEKIIAPWKAKNDAIVAAHRRASDEADHFNRSALEVWEPENGSRQSAYERARREIEQENQRLTSAWEALTARRQSEHERACREVDEKNRRLISHWQTANSPWVAEEKRWRDRVATIEAEILHLEFELSRQRTVTENRFRQRKDEAGGIAASHSRAKLDYEAELRQAEVNSKKIQLEEHLDRLLIRDAKLKGITSDRIVSLESFGIATAKDVTKLNNQNQKVPGIGPVLTKRLIEWRDGLAASFRPQQSLPDSEKNRIANRYAPVMLPLGQSIQGAINELETIAMSHRNRETEMVKVIATVVQNLAVAEAHVKAMKVT